MNWPAMMIISLLFYYFLINDNVISQFEGIYLLGFLVVFVYIMISKARKDKVLEVDDVDDTLQDVSYFKIFFRLLIGGSALYFGSSWLVDGAKDIAINLGISEGVIGATVIAVGTSIPELSASIIAALKGEKAISLGNLIGSNIFNIGSVIGLTAIITPIKAIEPNVITNVYWMLGVAAILIPLVFIPKKFEINRVKGLLLLSIYIIFIYLAFQ